MFKNKLFRAKNEDLYQQRNKPIIYHTHNHL